MMKLKFKQWILAGIVRHTREPSNLSFAELPASALHQNKLHYIDQHLIGYQSVSRVWKYSKYFTCDPSLRDAKRKISYWPTSEPNFSETNRKIQNAQMC